MCKKIIKRRTIDIVINNRLHERIECKYNEQGELFDGNDLILELAGKRIYDEHGNCIYIKSILEHEEIIVTCDIEYYK